MPRVAVLIDGATASAAEACAIAFIGRSNARSFGSATCGLSTGIVKFRLVDDSELFLAHTVMTDRSGRRYGGPILPDAWVDDPRETVRRAVEWLQQPR
jgi:C-terminal processing protease CtpA/Prc